MAAFLSDVTGWPSRRGMPAVGKGVSDSRPVVNNTRVIIARSRPLWDQTELEYAEARVVPADPLVQFCRGILLSAKIAGEREGQPVDIGLQEHRQRRDPHDAPPFHGRWQFAAHLKLVVDSNQRIRRNLLLQHAVGG